MKLTKDTQKKGELRSIFSGFCPKAPLILFTVHHIQHIDILPLSQHFVINYWLLVTFKTLLRDFFIFRDVFLSNILGLKTGKMSPREIL